MMRVEPEAKLSDITGARTPHVPFLEHKGRVKIPRACIKTPGQGLHSFRAETVNPSAHTPTCCHHTTPQSLHLLEDPLAVSQRRTRSRRGSTES